MTADVKDRVFSSQEAAIEKGSRIVHGAASDRVVRMFSVMRGYGPPRVTLERGLLFTEAFQANATDPLDLKWAKALKNYAEKSTVCILDDELIVGRPNTWLGRWAIVYPELDGVIMPDGVKEFKKNKGKIGEVVVTDEDERIIDDILTPYWTGRDYASNFHDAMPEETRFMMYGPDPKDVLTMTLVVAPTSNQRHSQNWTPDWAKLIRGGVKAIREEARTKLEALDHPRDTIHKKPFLEAVIITCDAMTTWSRRYAQRATEMAAEASDPARKKELLDIAEVCNWVPENPARNFHEAVQCQWWGQLFNRIEQTSCAMGQGRMDQYLLPYYRDDIAAGRITEDSAIELLQCLWLHMSQVTEIKMNPVAAAGTEGFSQFCDICLGGQTADGRDATNELSYLILESVRPLQITSPDLCVRIHANTPERFLHAVAETIKDGKGYPKLLNDEMVIPFYLANGISREEANDWTISGCCENRVIHSETNVTANGGINYGSAIEMTIRDGKLKVFKDLHFGLSTGDPRTWTSFDEVWTAFLRQLEHLIRHALTQQYVALKMGGSYFASPQTSMLHDLAMEHCRDLHTHGEWMPGGLDHSCLDTIGKATAIDSLAAIKHLIFDTKKLTWDELLTATEANWEGHEDIRQICLAAPKYGNAIDWVDTIGYEIDTFILDMLHRYPKPNGQCFILRCIPITFHVPAGKVTWATPNGRPAHEYLSEGISAAHGMDVKGPTVTMTSMAHGRNTSYKEKGGELINMKFAPGNVAGEEGTRRLMQVIRTWSSLKLWHIQFNILNRETLLAAQKDPEKYRDLVVRIAGYSAYFVDLSPAQQAEIIARTQEAA